MPVVGLEEEKEQEGSVWLSTEASVVVWLCECWRGRRLVAVRAGLLAKRGGRASGALLIYSERWGESRAQKG